ncbi:MAG: hypothetical protein ACC656_12325, partial [Candidatus Heimdallarchaeota archaeon]
PKTQKLVDDKYDTIGFKDFNYTIATDCPQTKILQLLTQLKNPDFKSILQTIRLAGYHTNNSYNKTETETHIIIIDVNKIQIVN